MFDKNDLRGLILFSSLIIAVAGIALLVGSWDLPSGVSLGRRGVTTVATEGDKFLKPYAFACFSVSAILVGIYKIKKLWD